VPGPSAVLTALAVSGLPVDRFCFEGFAPRKAGERRRVFGALRQEARTMVFFESPHRTAATLAAMAEAFGADRDGAVCRELTKTYEEVVRGTLAELVAWAEGQEHGVRGEVTLVVGGATQEQRDHTADELRELVAEAEADGLSRKDAIARVATETGVRRQEVYAAAHA
jgi:16S rRNA (cytidine1402-2'-O)-methyltransferase